MWITREEQVEEGPPLQVWALQQVLELEQVVWAVPRVRIFQGQCEVLEVQVCVLRREARRWAAAKKLARVRPMCELVLLLVPPMLRVVVLPPLSP